jgi:hypothetical protein
MTITIDQVANLIQSTPCDLSYVMKFFELSWIDALDLLSTLIEFDKIGLDNGYYYWR